MQNKHFIILCFLLTSLFGFSQEEQSVNIETQRSYGTELKDKYNSEEFVYIEPEPKKKTKEAKKENRNNADYSWLGSFFSGIAQAFPWILGILALLIIIKLILSKQGFVLFERTPKKVIEKLDLTDEEIIDSTDLNSLLQKAIQNNNYRLAIRYYFLEALKKLNDKNKIKLDRDKTNSDYLFELKNNEERKQFSYISYLYDYVWYGEFLLTEVEFKQIESSFNNFNKQI